MKRVKFWGKKQIQSNDQADKKRELKDSRTKFAIIQWMVPIGILAVVIIVMLINFMGRTGADSEEKVAIVFTNEAEQYGAAFYNELAIGNKAASTVILLINKLGGDPNRLAAVAADAMLQNTGARKVVLCNPQGSGVDEEGNRVDLGNEEYFQGISEGEQSSLYVPEAPESGKPAIVTVLPVKNEGGVKGYLLAYFTMESFECLFNKQEHDGNTFYAIMAEDGSLLGCYGAESAFLAGGNLMQTLDKAQIYEGSSSYLRQRVHKDYVASVGAEYEGEKRKIYHMPLSINNWQLIMGVNKSYSDLLLKEEMKETRAFVTSLVIVLCAFFALVVVINMFIRMRYGETSKQLENQADTDLLTGLNNKIATERKIKEYIKTSQQQALIFLLDIDNFKKINDTMGHAFGDEILRELGLGLTAEFRVTDILGRTGGDEFMIFLKNIKDDTIINKEVSRVVRFFHDFKTGEYVKYSATASIGCAIYPRDADNFEDLYKAADKALYKAKKRGKNQLVFYKDEVKAAVKEPEKPAE